MLLPWHFVSLLLSSSLNQYHPHHGSLVDRGGLARPDDLVRRRKVLGTGIVAAVVLGGWSTVAHADVVVTLASPRDRLGVELYTTQIMGGQSVVAIKSLPSSSNSGVSKTYPGLQAGLVLRDFSSLEALQERLKKGPYPIQLVFSNLAAGGDAISDTGAPLVTAQDALRLAQRQQAPSSSSDAVEYQVETLSGPRDCALHSRRKDVLEIQYEASFVAPGKKAQPTVYDASTQRGTGQPYQMVLGSGDMLPGVDLGLYDMCPGQVRQITIPPRLAYGANGNRLFGVPPQATLAWRVELERINGQGVDTVASRDELEERVPYSSLP